MFQSVSNKMKRYTVFYVCKLLYVFGVDPPPIIRSSKLYLQHPVFVKPLLLPAAIAAGSSNGLTNTGCCRYSFVLLMMGGDPPETGRAVYRNKKIV